MKKVLRWLVLLAGLLLALAALALFASYRAARPVPARAIVPAPVPAADRPAPNPLRNAYFGELHMHSSYSMDAHLFGTSNDPRTAYRFAQGQEIELPAHGLRQRIVEPLDFAAVTDHAEGLGLYAQCTEKRRESFWSADCAGMRLRLLLFYPRLFKALVQSGDEHGHYPVGACGEDGRLCIEAAGSVWNDIRSAANEFYRPGRFTTLIGFEYSPTLVDGGMLHRNVIFRNDKVPDEVFSAADGFAEDLMRWLDVQCKDECRALSIPHNPNFSWGLMFGERNSDASPVSRETLALRARYERLVEIFQIKGSSECARGVGNNDEQCGFENLWPACTAEQQAIDPATGQHATHCVGPNDMVRGVLRRGLLERERLGFNPFQLGIVSGTDNHNGAPGDTSEDRYKGHAGSNDDTPQARLGLDRSLAMKTLGFTGSEMNPGGLTGVWATENTREAIWDALYRRATWGTSGSRIRVCMFAGYDFAPDLHASTDWLEQANAEGIPMGGELPPAAPGEAPRLLIRAMRDPHSAPLQKLQVVKGWSVGGETFEEVYDVACSDGLQPDAATHRCPDNGARVDLRDCSISADRGAAELATTWTDPDFDPSRAAFYYIRVLENPVCRYSQRDALASGLPHPAGFSQTVQERAWTSPVWYYPQTLAQ